MTADQTTYLDTLLLYFEEEIEGEAYFAELSAMFNTPDHKTKLDLLAQVERHAAAGVQPLIEKYGLTLRPVADLIERGRRDARSQSVDWTGIIAEMTETYPGYIDAFQALESMGPAEDQARLSFLTEHEVAALAFLSMEEQDPAISATPLHAYLSTSPESAAA